MKQEKPIICRFYELAFALRALHHWHKPMLDDLHDIWLMGAPSPDSRVLMSKHYDPRVPQAGNTEKRIVLPSKLATWVKDTAAKRGIPATLADARKLVRAAQIAFEKARTGNV